MGKHKIRISF